MTSIAVILKECLDVLLWRNRPPRQSRRPTLHETDLAPLVELATREGYAAVPVDDVGPVHMVLLRGNERVAVLHRDCARWPRERLDLVRGAVDASGIWLPAEVDHTQPGGVRFVSVMSASGARPETTDPRGDDAAAQLRAAA